MKMSAKNIQGLIDSEGTLVRVLANSNQSGAIQNLDPLGIKLMASSKELEHIKIFYELEQHYGESTPSSTPH